MVPSSTAGTFTEPSEPVTQTQKAKNKTKYKTAKLKVHMELEIRTQIKLMVLKISTAHHVLKHSNEWKYSLGIRNWDPMFIWGMLLQPWEIQINPFICILRSSMVLPLQVTSVEHTVAHMPFSAK